jgi:hypothetical protein
MKNMTKTQKIWLWIFIAMFAVPEILFSVTPSSIINYSGKDFLTLSSFFVDGRFFINNPFYFFIILIVEIAGIVGLLVLSIKSSKKIIAVLLGIILLWLFFIFFLAYISNSISLVM